MTSTASVVVLIAVVMTSAGAWVDRNIWFRVSHDDLPLVRVLLDRVESMSGQLPKGVFMAKKKILPDGITYIAQYMSAKGNLQCAVRFRITHNIHDVPTLQRGPKCAVDNEPFVRKWLYEEEPKN